MRILVLSWMSVSVPGLWACSCMIPATPSSAAGSAAAVFTGTVLEVAEPARPLPIIETGPAVNARRPVYAGPQDPAQFPSSRRLLIVRIRVGEVLSGVEPGQKEIEILTGRGGGDCGYPFQTGADYVVYAYKNANGHLVTGTCNRTSPVAQASEDLQYIRAMAHAPETGSLRVHTRLAGFPGKPGVIVVAEKDSLRHRSRTDAAGDAEFSGLPPGQYTIHAEPDGDLPDDPKVQLYAKGSVEITLLRTLRLTGRVMTAGGLPAARIEIQTRSTEEAPGDGVMTDLEGRYELRIIRPGRYYLGVNLNHTPTQDTPYPRWFYPGTEAPALAERIEFSGTPETRTYDFTLPERQAERLIEGIVLKKDGEPMPRAVVTVFDSSNNSIAQAYADQRGRFELRVFAVIPYRLHAVWPDGANAVSAVPVDIQPGSNSLSLRLNLTQPGNSAYR